MENIEQSELIKKLNVICSNEHFCSDAEFAKKLNLAYSSGKPDELVNHSWSNNIVARRVNEYCKRNNMKIEDYNGPLPFKVFVVPVSK